MSQSYVRLPRFVTSLAVAGMLGFGVHAAGASPTSAKSCPMVSEGMYNLSCSVGPAGNAYCDGVCKQAHGPDSVGECFVADCCLCTI